jgi:hypothetical protein
MAQAVSRRPLIAGARVRSRVSLCGLCGGQSGTGIGFSPNTSVFPCQFHFTGAPLHAKIKKKTNRVSRHIHHRVARLVLRLRCIRSICFGALLRKKNISETLTGLNEPVR